MLVFVIKIRINQPWNDYFIVLNFFITLMLFYIALLTRFCKSALSRQISLIYFISVLPLPIDCMELIGLLFYPCKTLWLT